MAKDVHRTLVEVVRDHGGRAGAEADEYVHNMTVQRRYLRDVY
jgi:sulfite reductase (NADPH) flavoprotein alpha-component